VKVLDFGIVRAVRQTPGAHVLATGDGAIQGTPAFMAPEQVLGAEVDGRADIYATGCLAYWLLTGQLVFTAKTAMAMLVQHAEATPAPPSARTDRTIPRSLEELVLSCLAKDPADRPQSARELSNRLAELEGASAWTQDRAREWWATHRAAQASELTRTAERLMIAPTRRPESDVGDRAALSDPQGRTPGDP
jgi:serine/threonine-protein kinase